MTLLNVIVNGKIAVYLKRDGDIVCGNSGYTIKFSFDDEWNAYSDKTARFVWNGMYVDVPFTGDTCPAPIITNATKVLVGVYAGDLCTTTSATIGCQPSILCGTQQEYVKADQNFAEKAKASANEAKGYAEDAKRAADRAEVELETKLDKTAYPDYMRVYGTHPDGRQGMFLVSPSVLSAGGAIIMRDYKGNADVGDPTKSAHIANKKYVDDTVASIKPDNIYANVLKGTESGAVVSMDDVSPINHKIGVKIGIKNFVPYPYQSATLEHMGVKFDTNSDKSVTLNGTSTGYAIFPLWKSNQPVPFEVGQTYIIGSAGDRQGDVHVYVQYKDETQKTVYKPSGSSFTWQSDYTLSAIQIQTTGADKTFENYTVYPSIKVASVEEGTEIAVKAYGKNLATYPYDKTTHTEYGITWTANDDGTITVNGTATKTITCGFTSFVNLPTGTYVYSGCPLGGGDGKYLINIAVKDFDGNYITDTWETGSGLKINAKRGIASIHNSIRVYEGVTVNNLVFKPQFEVGEVATDFTPYMEHEVVSALVGESVELDSVYPNMTILSDTNGVNLECSYNKDTNKVIEKLTQAIISLGGNI